jgi:hypothetical protein
LAVVAFLVVIPEEPALSEVEWGTCFCPCSCFLLSSFAAGGGSAFVFVFAFVRAVALIFLAVILSEAQNLRISSLPSRGFASAGGFLTKLLHRNPWNHCIETCSQP